MADTGDFAQAELLARMNPVPDLGVQVRPTPQNVAALDQFRAERQRDFNWRNTFGQIPPADVLRETRDMISLTNRAIEQKMRLAAQTNHEAQNLYIKDQEFQEWQRQAPLRDELLKSNLSLRKASERAEIAQRKLANDRAIREAQAAEHTALAESELDQIQTSNIPTEEKLRLLRSVRGRYPFMDSGTQKRHADIETALTPPPGFTSPEEGTRAIQGSKTTDFQQRKDGTYFYSPSRLRSVDEAVKLDESRKKQLRISELDRSISEARAKHAAALAVANQQKASKADPEDALNQAAGYEAQVKSYEAEKRQLTGEAPSPANPGDFIKKILGQ